MPSTATRTPGRRSPNPDPIHQALSEKTDIMQRVESAYAQRLAETGRSAPCRS